MIETVANQPKSAAKRLVINTRPVERAAPLSDLLTASGIDVVELPLLTLALKQTPREDLTLMTSWLQGEFQALVIVSPTAAESGLAAWQLLIDEGLATTLNQPPSHLIAVGSATAKVLHEATLTRNFNILQPIIANNEGMLAMPEIEALRACDRLLVWRGLGGRRLLVDTLSARGVGIDSIAWYERLMPVGAAQQFQSWQEAYFPTPDSPRPVVIVSSGAAFENWEQLICNSAAASRFGLNDFIYVVLGERLAGIVAEKGLNFIRVEDLAPSTILAAILENDAKSS